MSSYSVELTGHRLSGMWRERYLDLVGTIV